MLKLTIRTDEGASILLLVSDWTQNGLLMPTQGDRVTTRVSGCDSHKLWVSYIVMKPYQPVRCFLANAGR
jgi:hypothetical protein